MRTAKTEARKLVAEALLSRVQDLDGSVRELACQAIREIWMQPFYVAKIPSAHLKRVMAEQVALMIRTIQRSNSVSRSLVDVLHAILSDSNRKVENLRACEALVTTMFETVLSKPRTKDDMTPSARATLQFIMTFAKADPRIFATKQLQLLKPYIAHVDTGDDLEIYRCVVTILRQTLPLLIDVQPTFLRSVRKDLMLKLPRLNRPILDTVFPCLWAVREALNDIKPLTFFTISCLQKIRKIQDIDSTDPTVEAVARRLTKLLLFAGMCSKYFNLDAQIETFRDKITSWKGHLISELTISTFTIFLSSNQPLGIRKAAFDAVGMACNSWPNRFTSDQVCAGFEQAFDEKNSTLVMIIMRAFKELLESDKHCEVKAIMPNTAIDSIGKLGLGGENKRDGVTLIVAQKFMKDLLRIALATQDDQALLL